MDWLKELLKTVGIEDTKIDEVVTSATKELPKYFIPKDKYNEVTIAKKDLEDTLKIRDGQLEDLGKKAKGNEDLEKQIKDLQDLNKTTKEEYEGKLKDMTITSAIQSKLTNAKYPELLMTKFDKSKVTLAGDGTVLGVDEQLKTLQEQYKDLFKPALEGSDPFNGGKGNPGIKNPWSKEHFNLTEQGKLLRENPDLAKQLMTNI